jgi:predicted ATP-grasp superfamily ATP-dependent carboligase
LRALIVEDGLSRQALAATRALAVAGWRVGVASPRPGSVAAASRHASAWHRARGPDEGVAGFADDVSAALAAGAYDVVFGARDIEAAALAFARDRLPARVAHPDLGTFASALDKLELARHAEAAGLAVPPTEAARVVSAIDAPVVVKPRVGRPLAAALESGGPLPGRAAARVARDGAELAAAVAAIEAAGDEAVVQERVGGELIALAVLADGDHSVVRSFQQRAELVWPLEAGISVRAEVVPADPQLTRAAASLIRGLRWSGIAQLQFLRAPGAEPALIDLNGRFYGSMALARAAGSNFADAWAHGALEGRTPDPGPARVGTRYHWAWGDLRRATQERRGGLARDLLGVTRYAFGAAHSVFTVRDPRPAARYLRVAGAGARRRRRGGAREAA